MFVCMLVWCICTGCISPASPVQSGQLLKTGETAVIGRLKFLFDFTDSLGTGSIRMGSCNLQIRTRDGSKSFEAAVWRNEYFVILLPNGPVEITSMSISFAADQLCEITTSLSIDLPVQPALVYVGDLVFFINQDRIDLKIVNRLDEIQRGYSEMVRSVDGKYLEPVFVNPAIANPMALYLYQLFTVYKPQIINGQRMLFPFTERKLIMQK